MLHYYHQCQRLVYTTVLSLMTPRAQIKANVTQGVSTRTGENRLLIIGLSARKSDLPQRRHAYLQ